MKFKVVSEMMDALRFIKGISKILTKTVFAVLTFVVIFGISISAGSYSYESGGVVLADTSNTAPTITGAESVTISVCDDSFDPLAGVSATDPDNDPVQITVAGDTELRTALTNNTPGTYTLTYTADDGRGGYNFVDRFITVTDADCGGDDDDDNGGASNTAPTITGADSITISVCDDSFDPLSGVSAVDPDNDPVQITVAGDTELRTALTNNTSGTYTLTYTADDGRGGYNFVDRFVTVEDADCGGSGGGASNTAPTITGAESVTISVCDDSFDPLAGVSATDPDNDPVQITVAGDTELRTALTNNTPGTYTLTYTADDGRGGYNFVDRFITVTDADCGGDDDDDNGGGGNGSRRYRSSDRDTEEALEELVPVVLGECTYLNDYLRIDFNNDPVEVMKLQAFLRAFEGFDHVEVNGIFDQVTFGAVNAFQMRYASDILTPWGYAPNEPTGYVYITTQTKINEIFCNKLIGFDEAEQLEMAAFRLLMLQAQLDIQDGGDIKDILVKDVSDYKNISTDVKVGSPKVGSPSPAIQQNTASTTDVDLKEPTITFEPSTSSVDDASRSSVAGVATGIYTGLNNTLGPLLELIFSTGFLIFILGIFLGWLLTEWYKGHRERKGHR